MTLYLTYLSILLYMIASSEGCQREQVRKCTKKYVKELDVLPGSDISSHCQRLKDVVGCFWSDMPSCTGEVITQWRAWVLQVASLETFLGICLGDYLNLQRMYDALPEDSKILHYYNMMQNADIAKVDKACAKNVHITCSKKFVEAVKNDKLICSDGAAWLNCYVENNNCDEKSLIYRYTQYVSKVAPYLEQECSQAVH
ncbi:uncharacterized protein [Porites lutea]|uniref:uncharacterized protein n=1 Tax=Porites lutea TaxID=51062 RepID=UPI003CC608D9